MVKKINILFLLALITFVAAPFFSFAADATLSWDANLEPDAAGYRVYYGTAPGAYLQAKGQGLDAGNALSYTAANLAEGNTYYFALTAYDQAGNESDYSLEVNKNIPVPDTQPPTTPTGLTAQAVSSTQIELSWTASTDNVGVTGYKIYRDGTLVTSSQSPVTSYTDTGLAASTTYTYTVSAYDAAGNESTQSVNVSVTTPPQTGGSIYYVSPTGSTSWPDCTSEDSPCLADSTSTGKQFLMASAGDTVYFLPGIYNPGDAPGWTTPAWNPANSGVAGKPITFKCLTPVTCTITHNTVGPSFGSATKNYITWDGFKSTKVSSQPIVRFAADSGILRNSEFIGFDYTTDGDNNPFVAGGGQTNTLIQNNYFHDLTGLGHNTAAILLYSATNVIVEKNSFVNNTLGIYDKNNGQNNTFRLNFFYNNYESFLTKQDAGGPGTTNRYIYQNIFVDTTNQASDTISQQDQPYTSTNIQFYNNTIYKPLGTSGHYTYVMQQITNSHFWNNIVYGVGWVYHNAYSNDGKPTYMDYNIYYNAQKFYAGGSTKTSLVDWQVSGLLLGSGNPDVNAYYEDPQFVNAGGSSPTDYKSSATHKNNGRGGSYASVIGAYITGDEQIGYFSPDTVPPSTPTNLTATPISSTQINLSWTASTDSVGVTGYKIYRDGALVTSHRSPVTSYTDTGLQPNTTYSYTVSAFDAAGNESGQSAGASATTLVPSDTTAPTVAITAPANNAAVSGTITVSASASDNVGVIGVQFQLDGVNQGAEDTTSPYEITLDTTTLTNGTHTLSAIAKDAAGNSATSSLVTITVNNIPPDTQEPTTPTGLTAQAVSSTQIDLSWSASTDNVGVTGYKIYRDGTLVTMSQGHNVTSYLDTNLAPSTAYTYAVSAYDAAGNESGKSISASATTPAQTGATYYVDQNHPQASDTNPGTGALPWKTIQKAADTLMAGDTVLVRAGLYSMQGELGPVFSQYGIYPKNSGISGSPITYKAYPGEKVIIDQGNQYAGFLIANKSNITISGFEIQNLYGSGVGTHDNASYITVENNVIHDANAPAGANIGAISFNFCSRCIARGNRLYNVSVNGDMSSQNASAIGNNYHMEYAIIENNEMFNAANGVFHKRSSGNKGAIIRNNLMHDLKIYCIHYSVGGVGDPPHIDQEVYQNICYNTPIGISASTNETSSPSIGLNIHNNVFHNQTLGIGIRGYKDVNIWNNIFFEGGTNYYERAISTTGEPAINSISLSDYNIFYPPARFLLNNYSSSEIAYDTLSAWQFGTGFDLNSLNSNPLFINATLHNFHLQDSSPARNTGIDRQDYDGDGDTTERINMGAYVTGTETIGANLIPFEFFEDFENPAACWPAAMPANVANCGGWSGIYNNVGLSQDRVISGVNSARITYTKNEDDGQLQRSFLPYSASGYSTFYTSFYQYFEPGFVFPATLKTLQVLRQNDFQPMMTIDNWDQNPSGEADTLKVEENGPNPYDYTINTPFTFKTGQWYHIETEYVLDTVPPPNSNGIVRVWINGTLLTEKTNVSIRGTSTGQMEGATFGINYSNGCCGGWKAAGPIHKYFDDIYIASGYTGEAPRVGQTRDISVPTAPTLNAQAVSSSQINLSWTASTDNVGVTGYKIYRDGALVTSSQSPVTSYTDTGLTASTTYTYTVSAFDAAGNESAQSASVSITSPTDGFPLSSPESFCPGGDNPDPNVLFCDDFEGGNLSAWDFVWTTDDVKTSTQTVFQGSNSAEFHYVLGSDGAQHRDANRMIEKNLPTQQEHIFTRGYFYFGTPLNNAELQRKLIRIQAPSGPGGEPYAWWEVVATSFDYKLAIAIAADPTRTAAVVLLDLFNFQPNRWYSIEIEVKVNTPDILDGIINVWVDGTQVLNRNNIDLRGAMLEKINRISFGHQVDRINYETADEYRYWDNIVISKSYIGTVSADSQLPLTPTNLTATPISSTQINLSWSASTDNVGVTGYKIYRDGALVTSSQSPGFASYTDTGLAASTTYTYTVSAFDAAGNESVQSVSVSATTLALPNNPPSLEPIAGITANEGEVITVIPQAADIDGDVLTYSVRGLPQDADYDFDSKTGVLNWRTTYEEAGEYDLNFAVDDGRN